VTGLGLGGGSDLGALVGRDEVGAVVPWSGGEVDEAKTQVVEADRESSAGRSTNCDVIPGKALADEDASV